MCLTFFVYFLLAVIAVIVTVPGQVIRGASTSLYNHIHIEQIDICL